MSKDKAQKKEKKTLTAKTSASVDVSLNKNDVIDMLVAEHEEKLEAELESVRSRFKELSDEFYKDPTKFKPAAIQELEDLLLKQGWQPTDHRYCSNSSSRFALVLGPTRVDLSYDHPELVELKNRQDLLYSELHKLQRGTKTFKAKLTRQLLATSPEGQSILNSLKGFVTTATLIEAKK